MSKDTRCTEPSKWWITLGTYGGSGWCVCDYHRELVLRDNNRHANLTADKKPLEVTERLLTPESSVLTTYRAEKENRKRCQWDTKIHGGSLKQGEHMTKFYVWFRQNGEGCDYTIGCGNKMETLEASTIEEARAEVLEYVEGIRSIDEPYDLIEGGLFDKERQCVEAKIFSFVEDAMPIVHTAEANETKRISDRINKDKRAQLEKLKRELGEI